MSRRPNRTARPRPRNDSRRPGLEALESRQLLTGYTVTTAADTGAGSLRAAIVAANGDSMLGADTISFAIPGGGVQTIAIQSPLPTIDRTVVIDGTTEPGSGTSPKIILDGSGAGVGGDGLWLKAGGGSVIRGLDIINFAASTSGGGGRGILVTDPGRDLFEGNYLGLANDGFTAAPDTYGIEIDSPGSTLGGSTPAAMNVITGNTEDGVLIFGTAATGNVVQGNRIGSDSTGMFAVLNSANVVTSGLHGIDLAAPGNTIGGSLAGQGNLISGNIGPDLSSGIGILLQGDAPNNLIAGNMIGVDATGKASLANVYGIYFSNPDASSTASNTLSQDTIGGTAGNLISGNFIGIAGNDALATVISRNIIGPDSTGMAMLPDGQPGAYGIFLGASGSTIGGTSAGAGNIISGIGTTASRGIGLELSGDSDLIAGNFVGTNGPGTAALPDSIGMDLDLTNSTVGGTTAAAGNVISGNIGDGVRLDTKGPVAVEGNVIGTSPGGAPGNGGDGVDIILPPASPVATTPLALDDTIGGTTFGSGNSIFGNALSGIAVDNTYGPGVTGLSFRSNSIARNGRLGIDLTSSGSAFPSYLYITSATPVSSAGTTTITGIFHGTPGVGYPIDLYANTKADASGYGQGQYFLGSATVMPGPGGIVAFTQTLKAPAIGQPILSATSTDPFGNTSGFSYDFPFVTTPATADLSVAGAVAGPSVTIGNLVTFTETVTNNSSATAQNVVLSDGLPSSLVNAFATTTAGKVSITSSTNVLTANLGSIAPGKSVTVTIAANTSATGAIQNTAGVSSTTFDSNYANNQASQSFTVVPVATPMADLAISEVASTSSPQAGANLTYVVTVTNIGPAAATNVKVNDFLPPSATLVGYLPSQGTTVNGTYLATTFGTIAPGASATVTIVVTPTTAGTITNAANVSGAQLDPVAANNSASLSLAVAGNQNVKLGLTQVASPSIGNVGGIQIFTLTVTNTGTGAATGVTFVDALPAGTTYNVSTSSQGTTSYGQRLPQRQPRHDRRGRARPRSPWS